MLDTRVDAAFAMAPMSVVFERDGAASINRPVLLYYAENDHVLPPKDNALHLAPLIVAPLTTRIVRDAGHYVFLSPCSATLARELTEICVDPPGVNRVAVHRQINADALAFFRRTLNFSTSR
jgi:predicted dienelactone hydrolase